VNHRILWRVIALANLAAIGGFVVRFCALTYPRVGHDFFYFIPRLLDTHLHYRAAGLGIQWYTPSFGGGLPAYPNPQHIQFSLPQLLTWVIDPWAAVLVSTLAYVAAGFGATLYLMNRLLGLNWMASLLGAVFFSVNGFTFEHLAVGHLGFQTFPMLPALLVLILHPSLPVLLAGTLVSLVAALLVYSGGFVVAVIFGLSLLILLPLLFLLAPGLYSWRRLSATTAGAALLTLALCGSKIWAVHSFMRFFPRLTDDSYDVGWLQGLGGLLLQLAGSMALTPIHWILDRDLEQVPALLQRATGAPFGIWELDVAVSPALWLILGVGAVGLVGSGKLRHEGGSRARGIAFLALAIGVGVAVEFTLAKGAIYLHLHRLPFLASLHANARFAAAFLLPLATLGAVIFERWSRARASRLMTFSTFLLLDVATLAAMSSYFLLPVELHARSFDVSPSRATYEEIETWGESFPIDEVKRVSDPEVFRERASSLHPYDVVFGHEMEEFRPLIHAGSVWETSDGYLNFNDPTGYVFPEENRSTAFGRIRASDRAKLNKFVHRRQPKWKLSREQRLCNRVTAGTLTLELLALATYCARAGMRRRRAA
jgi:hypothetical protein